MRILVDTSVWVDFFRRISSRETELFKQAVERREQIFIAGIIAQEILQGIVEDDKYKEVRNQVDAMELIDANPVEAAIGAAEIYRTLRKKGVVIRKANDCLIAWYAIHAGYALYHRDKDFEMIARHTLLKTMI